MHSFSQQLEKLNKNQLKVEDILEEDDLVVDVKTNSTSQFAGFFSSEVVRKLIDYAVKMPVVDDIKIGYKYPYNACEILCSENSFILDRLLEVIKVEKEEDGKNTPKSSDEEEEDNNNNKRIEDGSKVHDGNDNEDMVNQDENIESRKQEERVEQSNNVEEHKDVAFTSQEENTTNTTTNIPPENFEQVGTNSSEPVQLSDPPILTPMGAQTQPESTSDIPTPTPTPTPTSTQPHHQKNKAGVEDIAIKDEDINEVLSISQDLIAPQPKDDESKYKLIYETLDYFLSFIDTQITDLNHVLSGYFYKIFNHLMNIQGALVIKYLCTFKQDTLRGFIRHLNRKAIGECLHRILIYANANDEVKNVNEIKIDLVDRMLGAIQGSNDIEKVEVTTELVKECLDNKQFYTLFITNISLLKQVYLCATSNLNFSDSLKYVIQMLIKINENILKGFEARVTPVFFSELQIDILSIINIEIPISLEEDPNLKTQSEKNIAASSKVNLEGIIEILSENSRQLLEDFILNNEDNDFSSTYEKPQKCLGLKKLAEFEYFRTIIEVLINGFAAGVYLDRLLENVKWMIDKGIFRYTISTFYEYEFNNVYQHLFQQLIVLLANEATPEIMVQHFFGNQEDECRFLETVINQIENRLKFSFSSGRQINSASLAAMCEISYVIINSKNLILKKILEKDKDFQSFYRIFMDAIKSRFTKKLLLTIPSSNKTISNLDSINNEFEISETKEAECALSEKSLNEIIAENLNKYEASKNATPVERSCKSAPFAANEGMNLDRNLHEEATQSQEKQPFEKMSQENLFAKRDEKKYFESEPQVLEEAGALEEKNEEMFYDNHFWQTKSLVADEKVIKELLEELTL